MCKQKYNPIPSSKKQTTTTTTTFNRLVREKLNHRTFAPMLHTYNSTSRYRPHVHWNDESILPSSDDNRFVNIKKRGQRISLNASLPFHSKLTIRIHANRIHPDDQSDENNRVKATAKIQRLDPQYEHEYAEAIRQAYLQHYSTLSLDDQRRINLPIHFEQFPSYRQVSLPVDQRLFLYIRDGELFARC